MKIVRPGRIMNYAEGRYHPDIFCKIRLEDGQLSISGVIGPLPNGNARGGCGQIDMEFDHRNKEHNDYRTSNPTTVDQIEFADGWNAEMWYTFLEVWKVYHLNKLSAGCEHQRAFGWDTERIDPTKDAGAYGKFCGEHGRSSRNYKGWVYPPHGYLGKPCPICGYRYGTAWLEREIPQDVIDWLMGLPDTDKTPAWV